MKQIIAPVLAALRRGESAVLCTVLAASGSTPRGAGAHMAVFADGSAAGTVGGGAVELKATEEAQSLLPVGGSQVREYRLHPNEVADLGMVCGGDVTILLQTVTPEDQPFWETVEKALTGRENAWFFAELSSGSVVQCGLYTASSGMQFADMHGEDLTELLAGHPVLQEQEAQTRYMEPIHRAGMVYIFGAGHVSRALVPILKSVDFPVTVYDPRPQLASPEWFPKADRILQADFAHISDHVQVTADDYVVIMTPGHEADREVLTQMLRTEATYIGLMGSRRKIASTRAYLESQGFAPEVWERVHAPIGIPIRGDTPAEIAISITAEMIDHRGSL